MPLDHASSWASQLGETLLERIMWAVLLAVALLFTSALAAIAIYFYFTSEKGSAVDPSGVDAIAPEKLARFDMDGHAI
jgi:hypothetical protein